MKISMPEAVENIIQTLTDAGYEAYAVGGCVRDSILGRTPGDWDITTSANPKEVKELFRKTIDTGIKHGTVTVMKNHVGYEVTTYRIDGDYEDMRHPKEVTFTTNLKEDLCRRDFTINAMAYSNEVGFVDIFGGMDDLSKHMIRCVNDPMERFSEDALRMLRAVRFAAQLGFEIDTDTCKAIKALAPSISKVSAERIQSEIKKILVSDHPEYLMKAYELGITAVILPEFDVAMKTTQQNPHHCYSVGEHILQVMRSTPADKNLRLAALFHDIEKPSYKITDENGRDHFKGHPEGSYRKSIEIMQRLKMDNHTIDDVSKLVLYHDYRIEPGTKAMRRAVQKVGVEQFPALFDLQLADILAQSNYEREEKLLRIERNREDFAEIQRLNQCVMLKDLKVTGKDLIAAGITPGVELGEILARMLEEVIENPEHNAYEYLMDHLQDFRG